MEIDENGLEAKLIDNIETVQHVADDENKPETKEMILEMPSDKTTIQKNEKEDRKTVSYQVCWISTTEIT